MSLAAFNWADYAIVSIILISMVISLVRGLVREGLSLATWGIAFWVGFTYATDLSRYLTKISSPPLRTVISFFILFAIALIIGVLISYLIAKVVQKTGLSGTDRMLGVVFGFGRGALVIGLLMLVMGLSDSPKEEWWKTSVLIPYFKPVAIWMEDVLPDNLNFNLG